MYIITQGRSVMVEFIYWNTSHGTIAPLKDFGGMVYSLVRFIEIDLNEIDIYNCDESERKSILHRLKITRDRLFTSVENVEAYLFKTFSLYGDHFVLAKDFEYHKRYNKHKLGSYGIGDCKNVLSDELRTSIQNKINELN